MILSVSRRTDIPAFYSEWFMNRIREGFVYVRNPFNANQISKVNIKPDVVDCIVFWTKNPKPLMSNLNELDEMNYKYYFQYTITPYFDDLRLVGSQDIFVHRVFSRVASKLCCFLCLQLPHYIAQSVTISAVSQVLCNAICVDFSSPSAAVWASCSPFHVQRTWL